MKWIRSLLYQASPTRALVEGWLVCAGLLLPMLPTIIETTPLARTLFLLLLPLVCAAIAGLRMRFSAGSAIATVLKEGGRALILSLGILAIVTGLLSRLVGSLDSVQFSLIGLGGTPFFLFITAAEYLGVRITAWVWQRWNRLRRQRYVWALTHTILSMVAATGVLALIGTLLYFANRLGNDIWGIPPESAFANSVFWLTMLLIFLSILAAGVFLLFMPPAVLFSFRVAQKMTARLEDLAAVTQALRQGDLAKRVDVQGEDEIAQLQANFNAMATDLEQSIHALQAEKDKVWLLMAARRDLVAGVSHELRNPVAIILGYSDALGRGWKEHSTQEVEDDLKTIQYEAARLQTILNDLLTVSQTEAGHLQVSTQAVDVGALTRRVVETFEKLAWGSKRVQVTLAAPQSPLFALADPLRLEQVLVNLVQNAVRHTSPGGLVAVEVQPGPQSIRIEVEDTGEGIAPEDLPHIWEKYYQAGQRGPAHYGMGLGLSLVKELTEAMGGRVSVESWPGQGSLFQIQLTGCDSTTEISLYEN